MPKRTTVLGIIAAFRQEPRHIYRLPIAVILVSCAAIMLLTCGFAGPATAYSKLTIVLSAVISAYWIILYRSALRCRSVEHAAKQMGRDVDEVRNLIGERHIQPRYVVDGVPVYDPLALTDAAILLRAADSMADENLLRVAAGTDANELVLLRPARPGGALTELTSLEGVPPIVLPDEEQRQSAR